MSDEKKYIAKLVKGQNADNTVKLFENFLNEHAETHYLWEYEWVNDTTVSVVMRAIEVEAREDPRSLWGRQVVGYDKISGRTPAAIHEDELEQVCPDCGEQYFYFGSGHKPWPCDPRTRMGQH